MFILVVFHAIVFMSIIASVAGFFCILKRLKIYELKTSTRNFMYVGACGAMCLGFIGATVCLETLMITQWHYISATLLCCIGIFATAHLSLDFSDRIRIVREERALFNKLDDQLTHFSNQRRLL